MRANTINGQKPQFGNPVHIAFVKMAEARMSGLFPVSELDWQFVRIANRTTETRGPITYHCSHKQADAVMCYILCPRCSRWHKHVVGYDPYEVDQTAMWASIDEQEITCWNCGLEMYVEQDGSRNVYVRQHKD